VQWWRVVVTSIVILIHGFVIIYRDRRDLITIACSSLFTIRGSHRAVSVITWALIPPAHSSCRGHLSGRLRSGIHPGRDGTPALPAPDRDDSAWVWRHR